MHTRNTAGVDIDVTTSPVAPCLSQQPLGTATLPRHELSLLSVAAESGRLAVTSGTDVFLGDADDVARGLPLHCKLDRQSSAQQPGVEGNSLLLQPSAGNVRRRVSGVTLHPDGKLLLVLAGSSAQVYKLHPAAGSNGTARPQQQPGPQQQEAAQLLESITCSGPDDWSAALWHPQQQYSGALLSLQHLVVFTLLGSTPSSEGSRTFEKSCLSMTASTSTSPAHHANTPQPNSAAADCSTAICPGERSSLFDTQRHVARHQWGVGAPNFGSNRHCGLAWAGAEFDSLVVCWDGYQVEVLHWTKPATSDGLEGKNGAHPWLTKVQPIRCKLYLGLWGPVRALHSTASGDVVGTCEAALQLLSTDRLDMTSSHAPKRGHGQMLLQQQDVAAPVGNDHIKQGQQAAKLERATPAQQTQHATVSNRSSLAIQSQAPSTEAAKSSSGGSSDGQVLDFRHLKAAIGEAGTMHLAAGPGVSSPEDSTPPDFDSQVIDLRHLKAANTGAGLLHLATESGLSIPPAFRLDSLSTQLAHQPNSTSSAKPVNPGLIAEPPGMHARNAQHQTESWQHPGSSSSHQEQAGETAGASVWSLGADQLHDRCAESASTDSQASSAEVTVADCELRSPDLLQVHESTAVVSSSRGAPCVLHYQLAESSITQLHRISLQMPAEMGLPAASAISLRRFCLFLHQPTQKQHSNVSTTSSGVKAQQTPDGPLPHATECMLFSLCSVSTRSSALTFFSASNNSQAQLVLTVHSLANILPGSRFFDRDHQQPQNTAHGQLVDDQMHQTGADALPTQATVQQLLQAIQQMQAHMDARFDRMEAALQQIVQRLNAQSS